MLDISNKLHAMVDEFVSNLSSQCSSLAHNVSNHALMYAARDSGPDAAVVPRSSNRSPTEVLNGLRRPNDSQAVDYNHNIDKSHGEHDQSHMQEGNTRSRDEGTSSRIVKDMKHISASLEGIERPNGVRSVHTVSDAFLSHDEVKHRRSKNDMATKGKSLQNVEVLSSDHSSDECLRPRIKFPKKTLRKQNNGKRGSGMPKGLPAEFNVHSPSRSRESSHLLSYSYEEDLNSHDRRTPVVDPPFTKLRWPGDVQNPHEGNFAEEDSENNDEYCNDDTPKGQEREEDDADLGLPEDDDQHDEELGAKSAATESDDEELPVLPKAPVKRKLAVESRGSERRTQRGRPRCASPKVKKQRTPVIDATVITQLDFGKRPQNCVSTSPM